LGRGVQPRETALTHTLWTATTTAASATTASALVKKSTNHTLGDAANTGNHPCGEWKCLLRDRTNR
jgi:hypothetical protein